MTDTLVAGLGDRRPKISQSAFLAPGCFVLGSARIGARASIWYGTVVRADWDEIDVGAETNLQDGAIVHADPGFPVRIGDRVSVGHRGVLHGCTVADDVLVGMGASILNGADIGSWSLIAAGAVVLEGTRIPEGSLVAGVPGKVVRMLSESEQQRISVNAQGYLHLVEQHRGLEPLP